MELGEGIGIGLEVGEAFEIADGVGLGGSSVTVACAMAVSMGIEFAFAMHPVKLRPSSRQKPINV